MVCGLIREAVVADSQIIELTDPLSFGPLLRGTDIARWNEARTKYWKDKLAAPSEYVTQDYPALKNAVKDSDRHEIVIWAGASTDEQLAFLWAANVLQYEEVDPHRIRYLGIAIDPSTGKKIPALTRLSTEGFRLAKTMACELTHHTWEAIKQYWAAITAPSPHAILDLPIRPQLKITFDAIRNLKFRYPSIENGLGRFDSRLLEECRIHGPRFVKSFVSLLTKYDADTDRYTEGLCTARLLQWIEGRCDNPLITLAGDLAHIETLSVHITDHGRAVSENRSNNVELNGIDEWVAGVHLRSATNAVWYYDQKKNEFVPS